MVSRSWVPGLPIEPLDDKFDDQIWEANHPEEHVNEVGYDDG